MATVAMNNFARRQTAESNYSHYAGGFDALCALVEKHLSERITLSNEGGEVALVKLPGEGFFSASVQAESGMEFKTHFAAREEGEYPYFSQRAVAGPKVPATETDIILYSNEKLRIKNEQSTEAAWEIVSINAKRVPENEPPHPVTMLRNHRNYPGGTPTSYTAEQWADAVEYWIGGGPQAPFVMLDIS